LSVLKPSSEPKKTPLSEACSGHGEALNLDLCIRIGQGGDARSAVIFTGEGSKRGAFIGPLESGRAIN
jgi:hypothetical protein